MPFIALLTAFSVSALAASLLLSWLLATSYRYGIFDQPSERKVHKNNIPRLGGVAFVPATLLGILGTSITMTTTDVQTTDVLPSLLHTNTQIILLGCTMVYGVGIIDDLFGTSALTKLTIQFLAAACLPLGGLYLDNLYGFAGIYELPYIVGVTLTIFITLLITNALNLIDGIDGLAACLSLVMLTTFAILFYTCGDTRLVLCCVSLCGALCAFLLFNVWGSAEQKLKTFMGDSGSLMLGFIISYLVMKYAMYHSITLPPRPDGLLMALTLPLIPCLDLCRVAIGRLSRRQGIFVADKTHLHHRLMANGLSMRATLAAIVAMQLSFMGLNLLLFRFALSMECIVATDIVIFFLFTLQLSSKRDKQAK